MRAVASLAVLASAGVHAGCGRVAFEDVPSTLVLSPPSSIVLPGQRVELRVTGGYEPLTWTSSASELLGSDIRNRAIDVEGQVVITVQDAAGETATTELTAGAWTVEPTYLGDTGWAYPNHIFAFADGQVARVVASGAVRRTDGSEAWLALGSTGGDFSALDEFQLEEGVSAMAVQAVQIGASGCAVVGQAGSASGMVSIVRASADCTTFTTADTFVPAGYTAAMGAGIAVDATGGLWTVTRAARGASIDAFVRFSGDAGATWSTLATIADLEPRSIAIAQSGQPYVVGVSATDFVGLLLASTDGTAWTEVDRFDPVEELYFHGGGRPALVESPDGSLYYTFSHRGTIDATVRRFDPGTGAATVVGVFDAGPHAGGMAAGLDGAIYAMGRASRGSGASAEVWALPPGGSTWISPFDTYQRQYGQDSETDAAIVLPDNRLWIASWGWGPGGRALVLRLVP